MGSLVICGDCDTRFYARGSLYCGSCTLIRIEAKIEAKGEVALVYRLSRALFAMKHEEEIETRTADYAQSRGMPIDDARRDVLSIMRATRDHAKSNLACVRQAQGLANTIRKLRI